MTNILLYSDWLNCWTGFEVWLFVVLCVCVFNSACVHCNAFIIIIIINVVLRNERMNVFFLFCLAFYIFDGWRHNILGSVAPPPSKTWLGIQLHIQIHKDSERESDLLAWLAPMPPQWSNKHRAPHKHYHQQHHHHQSMETDTSQTKHNQP